MLLLNLDPATLSAADSKFPPLPSPAPPSLSNASQKQRDRGFASLGDYSPPDSPRNTFATLPPPPPFPSPSPGKATPPPIDPGVFRSVAHIRRLIDEAAELSVRASSGMSAAALGSLRGGPGMNGSAWATAQSLGLNPLGDGGGRNVAMSAMRIHRLRALAVQKLAAAYKTDEIASSVMVMQGGSVFDDIAERVLKYGTSSICVNPPYDARATVQTPTMSMHDMCISSTKRYPPGMRHIRFVVALTNASAQATRRVHFDSGPGRTNSHQSSSTGVLPHTRNRPLLPG